MKKRKKWLQKNYKNIAIDGVIMLFVAGILAISGVLIWVSTMEIPDLSSFEDRRVLQTTKIYDRTGEILLYDLHQDVKRTIVPYSQISRHIKNATVAIEDERFYSHYGIDLRGITRAAYQNLTQGDLLGGQGGSTITQQVIKNSILQKDKKLTRKIKEAILAIKLERILTKDEILAIYLNESPYGGTIYGVEEASQSFFGKKAADVTIAEAAYLAALPQAPTYLSPYGNNREDLDVRKNIVLEKMFAGGFITEEEKDKAINSEVEFLPASMTGIRAPHFVMYIREQLVAQYGEEALAERGFRVITTLDYELQKEAEAIVAKHGESNITRFNAHNAGLVATDPKTGDVLVMVGSRDYFSEDIDGNYNVTLANRQPGSSIKPFAYATAFSKGYMPETIVFDVKTQFSPACDAWSRSSQSPCYAPNNYNNSFLGPVSLRNALAQSLNIPAVKVLYLAGMNNVLKLAADMGLTTLNDPKRYGLTLVLGGGEVKLLDMTHAYGVFANEGLRANPRNILRIEDPNGNIVYENKVETKQVINKNVASMISDILSDNVARTPLWGANSLVNFPDRDVASKTGSTNNFYDAWLMGYTPNLSVGVWVGNNIPSSMNGLSGLIVTPMWREFMDFAVEKRDKEYFTQPNIDLTNKKPIIRGEYIDANIIQQQLLDSGDDTLSISNITGNIHTILHFVNKDDPNGNYPTNPNQEPQYYNWEYAVSEWKKTTYGDLLNQQQEDNNDEEDSNNNRNR